MITSRRVSNPKRSIRSANILVVLGLMFSMLNTPGLRSVQARGEAASALAPGAPLVGTIPPPLSFEAAVYRDETHGFEFDYPAAWSIAEPLSPETGQNQVLFSVSSDEMSASTVMTLIVQGWDMLNDLDTYINHRITTWLGSGMTLLTQDPVSLAGDRPGVNLLVQAATGERTFFFFTALEDTYLELSGHSDPSLLKEVAATVRPIAATTPEPDLPILEPYLSEDGRTLYNGVPPLVIVVDPDPARQGIQVPREPEVVAAIEAALADPEMASAAVSITFTAAGGTDPWGKSCLAFPAGAQTAFRAAGAIWTSTLESSVPITITACWSNLNSTTKLGYSGGQPQHKDFTNAPWSDIYYQGALANALAGEDLETSKPDMYITYNSTQPWYYGTDGVVPAGQYDLVTIAAHEIAHGLNFSGTASYAGGKGSFGYEGRPNIYDTFLEDKNEVALVDYETPSTELGTLLRSNDLWFFGYRAKTANGGTRVKIYAPATWKDGSSYSHLDFSTFSGTANNMMVFAWAAAASQHNPGPVAKGLLQDLGWTLTTSPTPKTPSAAGEDTTPTFTWSMISGATSYNFAVYKGASLVYSKDVTCTGDAAGGANCSNTPTNVLSTGNYTWKVRATIGGVWKSYSAAKSFTITNIPAPQTPACTTTDSTPTFTWTRAFGATQYTLAVYNGTTSLAYTKNVVNASCGSSSTTCSYTPTNVLSTGAHAWKVKAYVGGAWKTYSSLKSFPLAASTAFDTQFASASCEWTPLNGTWSVASGSYKTAGLADKYVTSRHVNNYSTYSYEVRLNRTGGTYPYGIFFNGAPTPITSLGRWNNGYAFFIRDDGNYFIGKYTAGALTTIQNWTSNSGISSGWNTLKVTYNSSTRFVQFYINGTRIGKGTFSSFTSGQVGVGFYRSATSTGDMLYVDYAKLSLTAPSAVVGGDGISIDDLIEIGIPGDADIMAP